jgi:hypothetical protein
MGAPRETAANHHEAEMQQANQQLGVLQGVGYAGYTTPTFEDVFSLAKKLNDAINAVQKQDWAVQPEVAMGLVVVQASKVQNPHA